MRLGDFSSVLQLGVGLHAGTALLQSIAEFASSPLSKRIERLAKLAALRRVRYEQNNKGLAQQSFELESEVLDLQSSLELKKVQFFNEYRIAALVNTFSAIALFVLLVWAAVKTDESIGFCRACFIVIASFAPATLSLGTLWQRWHTNTADVRQSTDKIENKLLG
jgi:hypothetical protein